MKKLILAALVTIVGVLPAISQSNYKISSAKNMIKGTSSLHDWQCVVEKQGGDASINTDGTFSINSLNIRMVVKSIRSVKANGSYYETSMDKNTYKALNADKYPEIVYTLSSVSNVKTSGNKATMTATGNLTIAGKTNKISFPVTATINGNTVNFSGATKFNMSLFGIKPPTALMGTIKTGDAVTIVINTTYSK
ncbi:MAG: YceI family protein [Niabella sp.]